MTGSGQARTVWCCSKCGAIYRTEFPRCPSDGAEVIETDRDPLVGTNLDRYVIDRLIGEGGMGRVYAAHEATGPARKVAIKVLLGDHAMKGAARTRFLNEAQHVRGLSHPNIVGVVGSGETPHGLLYIVMELVEGRPFDELIDLGPIEPLRLALLSRDLCAGLSHAHGAGLVHRDLKPGNVLVVAGVDGERAKLVDFGLAKTTDPDEPRVTSTGVVMGTPAYMAPEQTLGIAADAQSDLYALGVSMFEAATGGKLPFEGTSIEIVTAKASRPPPTLAEVAPEIVVPASLQSVIMRLLAPRREDRYATAAEVSSDLDRVVAELTRVKRRPRGPLVGVALATVAAGAGVAVFATRGDDRVAVREDIVAVVTVDAGVTEHQGDTAPPIAHEPPGTEMPVTPRRVKAERTRVGDKVVAKHRPEKPVQAAVPEKPVPETTPAQLTLPPPANVPSPPPAPLRVALSGLQVEGALTASDVDRAISRLTPALAKCAPSTPATVRVDFTIDASRRAKGVRASGGATATNTCVASVVGTARTHEAPDVGDAQVSIRVGYVVSP